MVSTTQNNVRLYSYLRFSDPRQKQGGSIDRQYSYAKKYAKKHGYIFDKSLSLKDEGLSAYHQKNITKGALGTFYRAIEEGLVAPGSVLIVEDLDRLSRANPRKALAQFLNIINCGITLITANDEKTYSEESIDSNPYTLFESIIHMVRANSESENKSVRVKETFIKQIESWIKNGHGKIIALGSNPYWVKAKNDKTGFVLIEERVMILREIVGLYKKGFGLHRLHNHLMENYKPFNGNAWHINYLTFVLRNRALIGERCFNINNTDYVIKNYYPQVLSDVEFIELQKAVQKRATSKTYRGVPSLITGAKMCFCGHCGSILNSQVQVHKNKSPLTNGRRRILCSARSKGKECFLTGKNKKYGSASSSIVYIEKALLEYCADQMELMSILSDDSDKTKAVRTKLGDLRGKAVESEAIIENGSKQMAKLLAQGDDVSAINNLVRQHQIALNETQGNICKLEDELKFQNVNKNINIVEQWQQIEADAHNMDEDARLLVRQIVLKTFKRIHLYLHSFNWSETGKALNLGIDDNYSVMVLTFINDKTRLLVIDRKTGDWVTHRDFTVNESSVLSGLGVDPEHHH